MLITEHELQHAQALLTTIPRISATSAQNVLAEFSAHDRIPDSRLSRLLDQRRNNNCSCFQATVSLLRRVRAFQAVPVPQKLFEELPRTLANHKLVRGEEFGWLDRCAVDVCRQQFECAGGDE